MLKFIGLLLMMNSLVQGYRVYPIRTDCVTFTVGQGTGFSWMRQYCAEKLGTSNYYFKGGVCQGHGVDGSCTIFSNYEYTCCVI